jgi:photosystem II stability/assembly factor-like uncharacterized protein
MGSSRCSFVSVAVVSTVFLGGLAAGWPAPVAAAVDEALFQGLQWRNIGPFRGGRSNASVGVPTQPQVYYFGGVGSGVWKTTDGGETWVNVSDDTFGTASVGAIAVAGSDPNVVWVGMGEHAVRGVMTSHGDGVYKSTDAGATWTHLGLEKVRQISAVRIHPDDPDTVWVAAQGAPYGPTEDRGIYKTTDGGATWRRVLYVDRTAGASGLSVDPDNPRVLYAAFWDHLRLPWQVRSGGPGSGIWKSTDGGESWERLGEGEKGFPKLKGKISVAAAPGGDRVYALIEADPGGGVYRSDDGGRTWQKTNEEWGLRARAWYYIKIYADPVNPDVVWVTNAQMYRSIDGGRTFTTVRTPHGDNHDLWINPLDTDLLINANDGGANVSYNGGRTWSTQQNQPTAQFYRVNVDNQFPYHVYGGQQDNSAIGIENRAPGGIGWEDFYSVAGCESAWAAFDPDDPRYVYGGCYMGILEEWDRATGTGRDVMAYSMMPASMASRDMKYRFNWSSPVVASPFDPAVIYHAANVVLKTSDRGQSWVAISPDLTRDEDEKQGRGGGPITNEGAGGEIYGTIYTLAASRLQPGVLWTGSDDGLVHVTRDDGATWDEVTPPGVGEAIVNAVEASPHAPGRAYVAMTRYKFNDFTPLAFKTDDWGRTWTPIARGIPEESWVRVVREDPVRAGLLYMGTETGPYVSFDDGASWQELALDMPVAAITDLIVHRGDNDLVASTAGRSFWILDDLSPLQQLDVARTGTAVALIDPEPAYRTVDGGFFGFPRPRVGQNPPGPATLDLILGEVPEAGPDAPKIELDIRDAAGELVRRWEGEPRRETPAVEDAGEDAAVDRSEAPASEDEGERAEKAEDEPAPKSPLDLAAEAQVSKFEAKQGHNRVPWDLRHQQVQPIPGRFVFGSLAGRRVVPGTYRVTLRVGDAEASTEIEVRPDPRADATPEDFRAQDELMRQIDAQLEGIHQTTMRVQAVRDQVERYLAAAKDHAEAEAVADAGRALIEKLTGIEEALIQKRTLDGQTVINFETRLDFHTVYLRNAVDLSEGMVTQGQRDRFTDLAARWAEERANAEQVLGAELAAFNALVREKGVPTVLVP